MTTTSLLTISDTIVAMGLSGFGEYVAWRIAQGCGVDSDLRDKIFDSMDMIIKEVFFFLPSEHASVSIW